MLRPDVVTLFTIKQYHVTKGHMKTMCTRQNKPKSHLYTFAV